MEDVRETMSGFGSFGAVAAGGSGHALQRQDDSAKQSQSVMLLDAGTELPDEPRLVSNAMEASRS